MLAEDNKNPMEEILDNNLEDASPLNEGNEILTESAITEQLNRTKAELAEQKDKFLRLYAEFDNFKRRTSKERLDLIRTAGQDLILDLLPILDDFDRAQKLAIDTNNKDLYPEGLALIHNKILSTLTQKGLKQMESTGETFDPESHEAIAEIPAISNDQITKIIDTVEKGYSLSDKIIRFAKVVVGK